MKNPDRTRELTAAALRLAERNGWSNLTRDGVAAEAGVSQALVTVRLGTMPELRRKVMRAALANRSMRVIAEGLAAKDKHACRAPEELKQEAAEWLRAR